MGIYARHVDPAYYVQHYHLRWGLGWFARHLIAWLVVALASVGYVAYVLHLEVPPALRPALESVAEVLARSTRSVPTTRGGPTWVSVLWLAALILANNVRVELLSAAPFIGVVAYPLSLTVTAWVLRLVATARFGDKWLEVALGVLRMPHTYLELLAYSIVLVEGCVASYYLVRRGDIPEEHVRRYAVSLGVSLAVLTVAALVEAYEIVSQLQPSGTVSGFLHSFFCYYC
jgi:uncharacterized membrane protein SpoIIM required for sporulation